MRKFLCILLTALTVNGYWLTVYGQNIRVMTYNVRHCAGMKYDLNLERTASVIEKYHADFVALQELDSCAKRSQTVYQAGELGRHTLMHATYGAAIPLGSGSYGVGLLSKERPVSVKRIPMPSRDEDRMLLVCEFKECVVACTHLSLLEDEHDAACDTILREAALWQKPFILMGDWNSHPDSPFLKRMQEHFIILSNTDKPTYPADKPNECIDYIAVYKPLPSQLSTVNYQLSTVNYQLSNINAARRNVWVIEDSVSSDHRPIVADLTLKTPAARLMTTKPYLQDPRHTEMTVMFQTNSVCHTWVEYGEDSLTTQRARTMLDGQEVCYRLDNRIRLTNLKPGQRYYYRVCVVGLTKKSSYTTVLGDTLRTPFYSFKTPVAKSQSRKAAKDGSKFSPSTFQLFNSSDFTALVFNDLHQVKAVYDTLRTLIKDVDYDFVIFNGDCLPEPTDYSDAVKMIHNCADPINGAEKPVIFIRGNHEIRNFYSAGMHDLIGYRDDKTYGAFTWGGTRFVILDAGEDKPDTTPVYAGLNDFTQLRQDQADFLRAELKSKDFRKAANRVLISHIPVFGNDDKYRPCTELWGPIVKDQPFNIAIGAHNHELKWYAHGTEGASFPVLIGGGPSVKEGAVSILSSRGGKLHVKTLTTKGVFLDQDL
ncbi:MAG: endonuclease/exonuclease/phosphatase family protein [Bacteroidaceae bacterium]|nr:endonuclease/exonuclease/phosphatase family protein [Bacteroidaceae bacterium]